MRILNVGDIHWTMTNPARRVDAYYESIGHKLDELVGIAAGYDATVFIGDLFHSKSRVKWLEWSLLADKLKAIPGRKFVIPGNHDLFGGNYYSWEVQPIGALVKAGIVEMLDKPVRLDYVWLVGIPFSYYHQSKDYYLDVQKFRPNLVLCYTHDMILKSSPPFDCRYLLMDDVMANFDGDILFNGHLHYIHEIYNYGINKKFVQLGSVSRGVLNIDDKDRPIQVVGLTVGPSGAGGFTQHTLQIVRPFSEVFDVNAYTKEKESEVSFRQFTDNISAEVAQIEQYDIQTLIQSMPEFASLEPGVREVVKSYLSKVEMA